MNSLPEGKLEGNEIGSFQEKRSLKQISGAVSLTLVLLLGMFFLVAMILAQWSSLNQNDRILPASLLAVSTADYTGVRPTGQVQVVGLAIIGDMMRDASLQPGDLNSRLAAVTAEFLSPVPTATLLYPQNVVPSSTPPPALDKSPHPGSTVTSPPQPTAIRPLPPTNTSVVSQTVPPSTATPVVPVPTKTPIPNPVPTYTSTPIPPTSQPPNPKPPPVHPTQKPHPPNPTKKPKK
jgi:hypothetical protein